jgi:hypothetical protein
MDHPRERSDAIISAIYTAFHAAPCYFVIVWDNRKSKVAVVIEIMTHSFTLDLSRLLNLDTGKQECPYRQERGHK